MELSFLTELFNKEGISVEAAGWIAKKNYDIICGDGRVQRVEYKPPGEPEMKIEYIGSLEKVNAYTKRMNKRMKQA